MPVLYANRAFSTLAASITNSATSLSVVAGHGARFPAVSGGDYFYATLDDNAGNVEIVKVTARSTDALTIVRAQDGTSALAFNAGSGVELRVVKAMLDDFKTDTRSGYAPLTGAGASGTWGISITGSAAYAATSGSASTATRSTIEDTRASQRTPNDYEDYRASYEFTNQLTGLADWHSAMTMQGWHNTYAAWQIIGPSSTSAHENFYLRSGINTAWNPARAILHSGNYTSYSPSLTGSGASGSWGISITGSSASATGNAATATALQTARAINGANFNGTAAIETSEWIHSGRDFPNGTLIQTTIDYSQSQGDPWILEIKGNSYGNLIPIDIQYQGYIYNDTVINHGGYSNGSGLSGLVLFNYNGKLCFWFPYQVYWQGFNVRAYSALSGRAANRLTSITNEAKPAGVTKELALSANIRQSLHSGNFTSYAPSLTGSGASGTWGISITGNAATASSTPYPVFSSDAVSKDDITTRTDSGFYQSDSGTTAEGWPLNDSTWQHLIACTHSNDANYFSMQIAASFYSQNWYFRNTNGSGTTAWSTMLHSGNFSSYSPGLTGGGASGTWGISISGNAATATAATTASQIDGIDFRNGDSSNAVAPDSITNNGAGYVQSVSLFGQTDGALYSQAYSASWVHQVYGDYRTGQIALRGRNNGTWQPWRAVLDSGNFNVYAPALTGAGASGTWGINVTGNAATATTLQTARTINGVSFSGSANITVTAATPNAVTFNSGGAGAASGSSHTGSAALTVSYNTVGAPSTTGANASGTWGISITGNAATVTNGVYTSGNQTIGGDKTFTGGLSAASYNGGQLAGMRNKIVNGRMDVAQRGASFAAVANGAYTLDRWAAFYVTSAAATVSQQADAPSDNEFQNSLRVLVTTADTSIAAGDYFAVVQFIEGVNVRDLVGRSFTLSFRVRSAKTGVHCLSLANSLNDRSYVAEYTVNAANTWETKAITVPGGLITAGTWNWSTGIGLAVRWALASGATFQSTAGSWLTGNFLSTSAQVNVLDTLNNIFAVTGIQLEPGSAQTPFEHRPFGVELALCQRYYQQFNFRGYQYGALGDGWRATHVLAVAMRAAPTFSQSGTWTAVNVASLSATPNTDSLSLLVNPTVAGMCGYGSAAVATLSAEL